MFMAYHGESFHNIGWRWQDLTEPAVSLGRAVAFPRYGFRQLKLCSVKEAHLQQTLE